MQATRAREKCRHVPGHEKYERTRNRYDRLHGLAAHELGAGWARVPVAGRPRMVGQASAVEKFKT